MKRKELIKSLLEQDLNQFRFSVWVTYNNEDDLEYALCLKGEKPYGYEIHLCDVGGSPLVEYNYDYIDFVIYHAIYEGLWLS